jgi:hypothetical protein
MIDLTTKGKIMRTDKQFKVIGIHAITHKYVEHCYCQTKKDAFDMAQNLHDLGIDGEIHEKTKMGWVKIDEFHWNEKGE